MFDFNIFRIFPRIFTVSFDCFFFVKFGFSCSLSFCDSTAVLIFSVGFFLRGGPPVRFLFFCLFLIFFLSPDSFSLCFMFCLPLSSFCLRYLVSAFLFRRQPRSQRSTILVVLLICLCLFLYSYVIVVSFNTEISCSLQKTNIFVINMN